MKERTSLARWTPRRLLSLLMALIMTLSLLPTAALAAGHPGEIQTPGYTFAIDIPKQVALNTKCEATATVTITDPTITSEIVHFGIMTYDVQYSGHSIGAPGCTISADGASGTPYSSTGISSTHDQLCDDTTVTSGNSVTFKFFIELKHLGDYTFSFAAYKKDPATGSYTSFANVHPTVKSVGITKVSMVAPTNFISPTTTPTVELGESFTIRAETNATSGYISAIFRELGRDIVMPISPTSSGTGYAEFTFTAPIVMPSSNTLGITCSLYDPNDISGTHRSDLTINLKAPDAPPVYHTVTFHENAAGVYNMPAPQPVVSGGNAVDPAVKPQRDGYTFGGWYTDAACTAAYNFTATAVNANLELYAKWTAPKVTVTLNRGGSLPTDVTISPATPILSSVGSVVNFNVTVPDKYDTAEMAVTAGVAGGDLQYLVPVFQFTNKTTGDVTFHYQFTVKEGMTYSDPTTGMTLPVHVRNVTEKTFTVMMPTGHFDAVITAATPVPPAPPATGVGSTVAADGKSASIVYDGSYTFTVTPHEGYDVEVYVNGAKPTAIGNSYTVPDVTGPQRVEVVESAIPNYNVTFTVPLSGEFFTQSVARDGNATEPSVKPEREGYTFIGWYAADQYPNGAQFSFTTEKITKDTVLFGKLMPKTYIITYDGNGSDGGTVPTSQPKDHGTAIILSTNVPTRTGYTFLGWGMTSTATAANYQPGDPYSVDGNIKLYAVWQKNTYTITFSSGEGYSLHSTGSMTVAHGDPFEFNLFVDPAYAQKTPTVYVNTGTISATVLNYDSVNDSPTNDGAKVYHYKLEHVTANTAINAEVTANTTYTVTFMTNGTIYQTQQVEFNHKATQPVDPKVEGFTFGGWYKGTTAFDFDTPITEDTRLDAKLTPIEPVITWPTTAEQVGYTIEVKGTAPGATTETTLNNSDRVAYGSTVTFTIKILDGYDASQMQVGINNVLLAPKSKSEDGKTYTFEFTAKENTKITVVGVARKTVTIIYNANARDDVSGMPEAQTVKYYLNTVTDNDTIINQTPVRTGYDFLGWSRSSEADAADTGYDAATIKSAAGATAKFTENTTLYAVWKAVDTTVSLKVTDVAATDTDTTTTPATTRYLQYEGEKITLQATLNFFAKGTVVFYKGNAAGTTGEPLGSTSINGKTAELTVTVGQYKSADKDEYYWVEFEPEADEGYAGSKSAVEHVGILSKAIRWSDTPDASNLLIYKGSTAATTPFIGSMVAGSTYTLQVRTGEIIGVEVPTGTQPVLGQDYKIVWQYYEVDKNDWTTVTESSDKDTYLVTGKYSGYQFRAQIVPLGPTNGSKFIQAAKYEGDTFKADQYNTCLYTTPTNATTLQKTTTELEITGADNEAADVYINGTQPFATAGSHLAQFEGKKVTLTATVTDTTTHAGVKSGKVKFFRYVDGTKDELLNTTLISVDSNGVATCEVEISNWTDGDSVTDNKDEFYAVYLANATYDTSASWTAATGKLEAVYIKSTTIKTPIIESKLEGEGGKKATTYTDDLTGLLAGVQHEFELRVGNDKADWSVVALDGRTVAAENYTIQWITKSGDNAETTAATDSKFKTSDNKVGDEIYVRLNPTGDMKTGADSKKAIIGTKQGVKVTVEACDEINSTPETDVYQLNKITLTATVAAKETTSTMKPTGTVAFYYSIDNGTTWTKIGDAKDLAEVAGVMTASIQTNQLPVKAGDNTKQNVEITAVYEGNETFNASATVTGAEQYTITAATGCTTTNDTVTVYSSVVYVKDTVENKTTVVSTKTHESGIYIYAEDDKVLANEGNVNLKLSEVYTLDHDIPLSKLTYNTDYTVQWQMLTNAAAYPDKAKENTPWTNITSATGTTCQINVEQGAAYRAVITVKDTPIAKGSFTEVQQAIPGHKVYYSNILVAANAPATLTVNVNTDNTSKGYEGIVEGETVTIHTFTSGATGTTPISQLTVNIYEGKSPAAGATPVFTAEKANVNGHVSFDWNKDVTPGYYTLKVKATFTNGYDDKEITRTLIVRDNDYSFNVTGDNAVYNGKVQGLNVAVQNMGIEDALAQKSVVVYYYTDEARTQQVEPTQAGTYYATVRLQESAYWTEKTAPATFTIKPREVSVVDLVAQAKVYDGTINANIQEIILNDATVNSTTGLPTDGKGIIDGDSVYAVGTGYTSLATAGTAKLGVKDVSLKGDDAANYDLTSYSYTEDFNIQRSQVKGAIVSGRTYKYTGKDIKLAASDIYLIDQAGNQLTDYDVTYYYHNGDGVEKVDAMNKMGKYTVIARPEQDNYKGGATETVYVGNTDTPGTLDNNAKSSLITISNTVKLYGATTGVTVSATKGTATASYYYDGAWKDNAPTAAGRYLVKATVTNDGVTDTAYGIYTIVKARPEFTPTTDKSSMEYTSGRYDGAIGAGFVNGKSNDTAETYITYTGGTIQGVAYEAPTEVGKYIATVHVGETANYTAHEKQVAFEITPKALTITADDISRQQYGAYPDLTASFKGLATGGVAADTSLRDVQIQPELIDKSNYTNDASDQVGNNYKIIAVAALARNYTVSYVDGNMSVTSEDPKPYLEIRGMIENGDGATDLAYYGDVIQLYAYGNQSKTTRVYNTSSILAWSVTGPASITQDGLLTVTGVGDVTVTLKRGIGAQQISTDLTFEAKKQEVKVVVPDQDLIYNGAEQKYDGSKFYAENAKGERITATPYMHDGKVKRTNVGSQIITSWVGDTNATYQSEHYCGLFTINVKDVTVKPTAATVTYGDTLGTPSYTEPGIITGTPALTDGKAVSEREDYINLDVLDGYEILVAGRENENYNVKYVTDQAAPDVEVKAKALTIKTGTLNSDGRTSGYLKDNDQFYKNEGFAITGTTFDLDPNDRMYGEVNPVMDYTFAGFVSGDSEADLVKLLPWLVRYSDGTYHNINGDANVAFDKTHHLSGFRAPSCMPGMSDYPIDSVLLANSVKNYTLTSTEATQNIYQRPVTLTVPTGVTLTAYKPTIIDASGNVKTDVLLDLLLNNLEVKKYKNGTLEEGGLAELLKHTIKDLKIQIVSAAYDDSTKKITATIKLGNTNYWTEDLNFTVTVDPTKIVAKYGPLGWTSASVTMVPVDEGGNEGSPDYVTGKVWYEIYVKDPSITTPKYSDYKGKTTVRKVEMIKGSSPGVYIANYDRLPAGEYVMFAIAEGYTIIE